MKEKAIEQLHTEGFTHVYEWTDVPNTEYAEHAHKGRVTFYVTQGSLTININGITTIVTTGKRIDVSAGILHSAKVGIQGCSFVVGEEIEGDS